MVQVSAQDELDGENVAPAHISVLLLCAQELGPGARRGAQIGSVEQPEARPFEEQVPLRIGLGLLAGIGRQLVLAGLLEQRDEVCKLLRWDRADERVAPFQRDLHVRAAQQEDAVLADLSVVVLAVEELGP